MTNRPFLAFPDSVSVHKELVIQKTVYSIRFPITSTSLFCHVLFVQIPALATRNSIQRSLVIVTTQKETISYQRILTEVFPTFSTEPLNEEAFAEVLYLKMSTFPEYRLGTPVSLKLFGKRFDLLPSSRKPFPVYLRKHLRDLRSIWISMLMGDSILFEGSDICEITETVHYVSNMIYPLEYSGQIRPYYTINDTLLSTERCFIIGVTNPTIVSLASKMDNINIITSEDAHFKHNVEDHRFDSVKNMSDIEAGTVVEKEFERNTIEFLSVFDGFFASKVPKMRSLMDHYCGSVVYTQDELHSYIKSLHFTAGKEETYLRFINTPSCSKYSASRITAIEQQAYKHLQTLLDTFCVDDYTSKEIPVISMNLYDIQKWTTDPMIKVKIAKIIEDLMKRYK